MDIANTQAYQTSADSAAADQQPFTGAATIHQILLNIRASGAIFGKLRLGDFTFSLASKDANIVYVKQRTIYVGKIKNNKFFPAYDGVTPATIAAVNAKLDDPKGAVIQHGLHTGTCSICGRTLTNSVSIAQAMGPICSGRAGF